MPTTDTESRKCSPAGVYTPQREQSEVFVLPKQHLRKRPVGKWLLIGSVLASVAIGSWLPFRSSNETEYRTIPVDRGDVEATVTATGSLNAVVTVQVGSQVSGNISELHADFNTSVKQGQLVARIEPQIFQAQVNQATAAVAAAKAAVVNAKAISSPSGRMPIGRFRWFSKPGPSLRVCNLS